MLNIKQKQKILLLKHTIFVNVRIVMTHVLAGQEPKSLIILLTNKIAELFMRAAMTLQLFNSLKSLSAFTINFLLLYTIHQTVFITTHPPKYF